MSDKTSPPKKKFKPSTAFVNALAELAAYKHNKDLSKQAK